MSNAPLVGMLAVLVAGCSIGMENLNGTIEPQEISMEYQKNGIDCIATGTYPKIVKLQSVQVGININSYIDAYVKQLGEDMKQCPEQLSDLTEDGTTLTDTTEVDYMVKRFDSSYLSIVLTRSQYFEGAAHPNNSIHTLTFNLKDGQPIELADLFNDYGEAQRLLIDRINDALAAEGIVSTYPSEASNELGTYYLTKDNVVLTDLFSVHAMQGFEVRVPFAVLKDLLAQNITPLST